MTRPDIAARQGDEPAHSRWNEDGVDYCGQCGRWMPEGTGRVAFDGTVICKGRPEKPAETLEELKELPAPAAGEDEALLVQADKDAAYLHARNWNDMGYTMQHLAARIRTLRADVARLERAEAGTRKALERAQGAEADLARLVNERDAARAALAAEKERGDTIMIGYHAALARAEAEKGAAGRHEFFRSEVERLALKYITFYQDHELPKTASAFDEIYDLARAAGEEKP